ncbi:MAG: 8-oxoguanine deaminase [Pseudomonadota bacterium]
MFSTLLNHCDTLVTMNDAGEELQNATLYAEDGVIVAIGPGDQLPQHADLVIDMRDHVVLPGLVNCHHHLYQNLTRVIPAAQDASLFGWLRALYPLWAGLTPEAMRVSTTVGLVELLLSGCTTSSDHHYLFPRGCQLDDQIEAALALGVRFHAMRGSMSIGESAGGLPPDQVVEDESHILVDSQRLIERWHNPAPHALLRIGLAPCSPFSVSRDLMRASAELARQYGVRLHTHLAENAEDIRYCENAFGMRPGDYAADCGWLGEDVWHAHCVHLDENESATFANTGTGVAHCPCSNMRLGSGIAPVRQWLDQGVRVGLGVDGSASNDSADLRAEARQALLLQRVRHGAEHFTAREALRLATRGGAEVLGRDDIGSLEVGKACDVVAWRSDALAFAGYDADPVAAIALGNPGHVNHALVQGRARVRDGELVDVDLPDLLAQHRRVAAALVNAAPVRV